MFCELVDVLKKYKEDRSCPIQNLVESIKSGIKRDLQLAYESSSELIRDNEDLYKRSRTFFDFLLRVADIGYVQPTTSESSEMGELRRKVENLTKELEECLRKERSSTFPNEFFRRERNDGNINELNQKIDDQNLLINDLKKKLQDCEMRELANTPSDIQRKFDDLQKHLEDCRRERDDANTKVNELSKTINNGNLLVNDLKKKLQDLERANTDMQLEFDEDCKRDSIHSTMERQETTPQDDNTVCKSIVSEPNYLSKIAYLEASLYACQAELQEMKNYRSDNLDSILLEKSETETKYNELLKTIGSLNNLKHHCIVYLQEISEVYGNVITLREDETNENVVTRFEFLKNAIIAAKTEEPAFNSILLAIYDKINAETSRYGVKLLSQEQVLIGYKKAIQENRIESYVVEITVQPILRYFGQYLTNINASLNNFYEFVQNMILPGEQMPMISDDSIDWIITNLSKKIENLHQTFTTNVAQQIETLKKQSTTLQRIQEIVQTNVDDVERKVQEIATTLQNIRAILPDQNVVQRVQNLRSIAKKFKQICVILSPIEDVVKQVQKLKTMSVQITSFFPGTTEENVITQIQSLQQMSTTFEPMRAIFSSGEDVAQQVWITTEAFDQIRAILPESKNVVQTVNKLQTMFVQITSFFPETTEENVITLIQGFQEMSITFKQIRSIFYSTEEDQSSKDPVKFLTNMSTKLAKVKRALNVQDEEDEGMVQQLIEKFTCLEKNSHTLDEIKNILPDTNVVQSVKMLKTQIFKLKRIEKRFTETYYASNAQNVSTVDYFEEFEKQYLATNKKHLELVDEWVRKIQLILNIDQQTNTLNFFEQLEEQIVLFNTSYKSIQNTIAIIDPTKATIANRLMAVYKGVENHLTESKDGATSKHWESKKFLDDFAHLLCRKYFMDQYHYFKKSSRITNELEKQIKALQTLNKKLQNKTGCDEIILNFVMAQFQSIDVIVNKGSDDELAKKLDHLFSGQSTLSYDQQLEIITLLSDALKYVSLQTKSVIPISIRKRRKEEIGTPEEDHSLSEREKTRMELDYEGTISSTT